MFLQYLPILFLIVLAVGVAVFIVFASFLFGPRKRLPEKDAPYECGVSDIIGDTRSRLNVKFFLIAALFIIFDVEIVFFVPWAIAYKGFTEFNLGLFALADMIIFSIILVVGFVYVWKRGALTWEK